ncbi:lipopolysaccharide biosynthesis protein [Anaerohalosphaeraceae bacterium U12dextr]
MNPNNRIMLNTAATYTRTVIGAGLSLFSSRWVLAALGQTDFGLFSVVGSIIMFIVFLNSVMATSVARHYAFSIGQNDSSEVNRWFNAALSMHIMLGIILVLVGWQVGEYVISHVLTIPSNRIQACLWVFRISLISALFNMISVPYVAMFTAKQYIAVLSVWGIIQSVLTFFLAFSLSYAPGDRLLFYACGMVGIIVVLLITQVIWAMFVFPECRINFRQWFNKHRFKEIWSFAVWSLIGQSGAILRNQGSAILLNIQFGPKVNAAYAIANTVSNHTNHLAAAMLGAFSPEITASEGRGDRMRMLSLSQRASKFGTILVLLFAVPIMAEMNYILKLWLGDPPLYAELFCQLILATFIIDRLSVGSMLAVNAHGKIAAYQATLGTCLVLTLPLAWIFLMLGAPPTSVGVAFVITMSVVSIGRVFWVRHLFGLSVTQWFKEVVFPCLIVASTATFSASMFRWLMHPSFARFLCAATTSIGITLLTTWFIALDTKEREFFGQNLRRFLDKIGVV